MWRLASLLLFASITSGCGEVREQVIALWPFAPATTPTPTTSPISLLGWAGSTAENEQLQQTILAFEQEHPNWPVAGRLLPDYAATLDDELASTAPPDLFLAYSHQLADLVADGHLLPIPSTYPVTASVAPNLLAGIQVEGQNYCFPRDVSLLTLFYNRSLFDRAEVAYPQSKWSWSEFRTALDATSDFNNGYYGLVLDYDLSRFHPFLLQSSGDDDLWQGQDAVTALEYFMDLYNDEVATVPSTLGGSWNGEAFGLGRAAMTIEGNWLISYLANQFPSLDYGIVELPTGPTGQGNTAFISCWVVNAASANPTAAFELATFLTSPSQLSAWADASLNVPPSIELATAWVANHPDYATFVNALPVATPWTGPVDFVDRAETVNTGMRMWYNDEMTTPDLIERLATMSENPPLPIPTATPAD
jgi:multiple sugar transport system substrate-binding protein